MTGSYASLRTLALAMRADDLQVEVAPLIGNNVLGCDQRRLFAPLISRAKWHVGGKVGLKGQPVQKT
jgi:hypothetical protein